MSVYKVHYWNILWSILRGVIELIEYMLVDNCNGKWEQESSPATQGPSSM